jgi:hypothetical protein
MTRPAALILALAALLILAILLVISRRERPVTATWPEEDDALPPFDPRTWPSETFDVPPGSVTFGPGWRDGDALN